MSTNINGINFVDNKILALPQPDCLTKSKIKITRKIGYDEPDSDGFWNGEQLQGTLTKSDLNNISKNVNREDLDIVNDMYEINNSDDYFNSSDADLQKLFDPDFKCKIEHIPTGEEPEELNTTDKYKEMEKKVYQFITNDNLNNLYLDLLFDIHCCVIESNDYNELEREYNKRLEILKKLNKIDKDAKYISRIKESENNDLHICPISKTNLKEEDSAELKVKLMCGCSYEKDSFYSHLKLSENNNKCVRCSTDISSKPFFLTIDEYLELNYHDILLK